MYVSLRGVRKPMWAWGELAKLHTDNILTSGSNRGTCISETSMLFIAPWCHPILLIYLIPIGARKTGLKAECRVFNEDKKMLEIYKLYTFVIYMYCIIDIYVHTHICCQNNRV